MVFVSRHETIARDSAQFVEDAARASWKPVLLPVWNWSKFPAAYWKTVSRLCLSFLFDIPTSLCCLPFLFLPLLLTSFQRHRTAIGVGRFSGTAADFRLMDLEQQTHADIDLLSAVHVNRNLWTKLRLPGTQTRLCDRGNFEPSPGTLCLLMWLTDVIDASRCL